MDRNIGRPGGPVPAAPTVAEGAGAAGLAERSVREIFETASSTAPAPGAGSVMALAGMWGAALVLKAIRITHKHDQQSAETQAAELYLQRLAELLARDAEEDAADFEAYVAALRRPKSDPERKDAISEAAANAAETAVRTLEHARAAVAVCHTLHGRIAEVMAADLEAGSALLAAAARTAGEDARESIASVRVEEVRRSVLERLARASAA